MAAPPNLDSESLWTQATRFRWLAREILPGEFRTNLLAMAADYELQAAKLQGTALADNRSEHAQPGLMNR